MYLFFLENNIITILLWLAVFLITIAIEIGTSELVSIWFSGASIIALVLACFDIHWAIQIAVFLIVAVLLLVLTRPFLKSRLRTPNLATNADSMIGSEILITKTVSKSQDGEGKFRDVIWTCKTQENDPIEKGSFAIIKELKGNHLIVTGKGK